jgi:heme-degrading monooxygenase HmoA
LHALLFEVLPTPEGRARYFEIASGLRPLLDENPGLLFIDRYESLTRPGLILSYSLWRDEASLARWRSQESHYAAQCAGRRQLFEDYRLRIGMVVEEWAATSGRTSESEEGAYNDSALVAPRYFATIASHGAPVLTERFEQFRSVYRADECIAVGGLDTRADFAAVVARVGNAPNLTSIRGALVSRDYGMHERAEAPQFLARE